MRLEAIIQPYFHSFPSIDIDISYKSSWNYTSDKIRVRLWQLENKIHDFPISKI